MDSNNGKWFKLLLFALLISALIILVLELVNSVMFHLFWFFPMLVFLLPFFILIARILIRMKLGLDYVSINNIDIPTTAGKGWRFVGEKNMLRFLEELLNARYNSRFALQFALAERSINVQNEQIEKLKAVLQEGDILLRRHKNYLDGVILAQTSYFTHAGIYYGINEQGKHDVIHAISFKGVSRQSLEEFCLGGEYVVLRFCLNKDVFHDKLQHVNSEGVLSMTKDAEVKKNEPLPLKKVEVVGNKDVNNKNSSSNANDIRTFIKDQKTNELLRKDYGIPPPAQTQDDLDLANAEGLLYDKLVAREVSPDQLNESECIKLVIKQAEKCIGVPYDHDFDFMDPKRLCCVELVWYCYKSLAPLIQVQREKKIYCGFINVSVIVPDMFLKNPFFKMIYHGNNKSKEELIKATQDRSFKFWYFLTCLVFYNILLFVTCCGVYIFFRRLNIAPLSSLIIIFLSALFLSIAFGDSYFKRRLWYSKYSG